MCGLAGVINGTVPQVEQMLDLLRHRGPDGRGIAVYDAAIHGHVRLALVDLSDASAQPFQHGQSLLSFNGEIWNYKHLRTELIAQGEQFSTTGDTEVLAALLDREGLSCLSKLDGMFAFAWSRGQTHFLVRDSFGKVPLYVVKTRQGYAWASERKAFARGTVPIAVPPGHVFNLSTGDCERWYRLPAPQSLTPARLLTLLRAGVAKRLEADAPVCCLISGGLDSSLILALARERSRNVQAFTAVYDPQSADARAARAVCADFGIRLNEVVCSIADVDVDNALRAIEIPSKAQVEIALLCIPLAQRMQAEGFKACLSGEAADELFGGYGNFCIRASQCTDVVPLRIAQVAKMARGNFVRCNKAFMAHGVECRLPFMEQALVESAIQLNKESSPLGKELLKTAACGIVPSWVIKRVKDTFQGGSGVAGMMAARYHAPIQFYNAEQRKRFGYLPKD